MVAILQIGRFVFNRLEDRRMIMEVISRKSYFCCHSLFLLVSGWKRVSTTYVSTLSTDLYLSGTYFWSILSSVHRGRSGQTLVYLVSFPPRALLYDGNK